MDAHSIQCSHTPGPGPGEIDRSRAKPKPTHIRTSLEAGGRGDPGVRELRTPPTRPTARRLPGQDQQSEPGGRSRSLGPPRFSPNGQTGKATRNVVPRALRRAPGSSSCRRGAASGELLPREQGLAGRVKLMKQESQKSQQPTCNSTRTGLTEPHRGGTLSSKMAAAVTQSEQGTRIQTGKQTVGHCPSQARMTCL